MARAKATAIAAGRFGPALAAFFRELEANNDRVWFLANRARYDADVHAPMAALVAELALAFAAHDVPLTGDATTSMFRINRDVRFGHDKRPYKTNVSAVLTRDGTKRSQGLMYIQAGADEAFAALGFYGLEPADLTTFRRAIVARRSEWDAVTAALGAAGLALSTDDALTRLPRDFDADVVGDLADTIRLKAFIVRLPLDAAALADADLVDRLLAFAQAGMPLLDFGWAALGAGAQRG